MRGGQEKPVKSMTPARLAVERSERTTRDLRIRNAWDRFSGVPYLAL